MLTILRPFQCLPKKSFFFFVAKLVCLGVLGCPSSIDCVISFSSSWMFFQTPASRLMCTLFCLWVNIFAIVASPLPYGNGSKASPPGQFGAPLCHVRGRFGFEKPPPRSSSLLPLLTYAYSSPARIRDLRILTTHIGESAGTRLRCYWHHVCVHAMTDNAPHHACQHPDAQEICGRV
ncbi:hypothetical protein F5879DRAFT_19887 [Lentinula edodes]|nr:hypothetical protein F5879DRAFT_19887 [Lentinula edodes]